MKRRKEKKKKKRKREKGSCKLIESEDNISGADGGVGVVCRLEDEVLRSVFFHLSLLY